MMMMLAVADGKRQQNGVRLCNIAMLQFCKQEDPLASFGVRATGNRIQYGLVPSNRARLSLNYRVSSNLQHYCNIDNR
jgi:hypothetical protein